MHIIGWSFSDHSVSFPCIVIDFSSSFSSFRSSRISITVIDINDVLGSTSCRHQDEAKNI